MQERNNDRVPRQLVVVTARAMIRHDTGARVESSLFATVGASETGRGLDPQDLTRRGLAE